MEKELLKLKEKVYFRLMKELCDECSWNLFLNRELYLDEFEPCMNCKSICERLAPAGQRLSVSRRLENERRKIDENQERKWVQDICEQ